MATPRASLEAKLKDLQKTVKSMKSSHYKLQSEYHRLMYSYTLEIENIQKLLNTK